MKADNFDKKKTNILMCGSDLSVKGGIVSVVKNHLSYQDWSPYEIRYIPTHVDQSRFKVAAYFAAGWLKAAAAALSGRYKILYLHTAERGSFDVISGKIKRAPVWVQSIHMEWFYRMIQEPKRLAKRYIVGNWKFIAAILKEKWRN